MNVLQADGPVVCVLLASSWEASLHSHKEWLVVVAPVWLIYPAGSG